jgi:Domain of unknown function (DUF4260)
MMPSLLRPAILLRVEYLALLVLSLVIYSDRGESWLLFALLILAPDLSFVAAIAGPRAGITAYNLAHTAIGPVVLALLGILVDWDLGITLGLIWFAHLAADRAIGYGLKYSLAKGDTHLGRI